MALKSDGTVVAWGWNEYGQTTVPAGLTGVTAIAAGHVHTVAIKPEVGNYVGSATGTLVIGKASQTITFAVMADRAYSTTAIGLSVQCSAASATATAPTAIPSRS